jgi:hypothetical protein
MDLILKQRLSSFFIWSEVTVTAASDDVFDSWHGYMRYTVKNTSDLYVIKNLHTCIKPLVIYLRHKFSVMASAIHKNIGLELKVTAEM